MEAVKILIYPSFDKTVKILNIFFSETRLNCLFSPNMPVKLFLQLKFKIRTGGERTWFTVALYKIRYLQNNGSTTIA